MPSGLSRTRLTRGVARRPNSLAPPAAYPALPVLCMAHTTGLTSRAQRGKLYPTPGQGFLGLGLQPGGPPSVRTIESGCSIVCVPMERYGCSSPTS